MAPQLISDSLFASARKPDQRVRCRVSLLAWGRSLFRRARAELSVLVEAYRQLHVKADKQRGLAVEARVDAGGEPRFIVDERLLE